MEKRIFGCDKCKREVTIENELWRKPDNWKDVTIEWGQYDKKNFCYVMNVVKNSVFLL